MIKLHLTGDKHDNHGGWHQQWQSDMRDKYYHATGKEHTVDTTGKLHTGKKQLDDCFKSDKIRAQAEHKAKKLRQLENAKEVLAESQRRNAEERANLKHRNEKMMQANLAVLTETKYLDTLDSMVLSFEG
jgi:hypothetical protein